MTHSMIQDVNGNIIANNVLDGYTTTATAAGTTTLTVASTYQQFFTGSTTQTVVLPVTSTLILGQSFRIVNNSSGVVTVQSSGANTIQAQAASTTAFYTCILTSGTSAASWSVTYIDAGGGGSGTVNTGTSGQLAYYATSSAAVSGGQLGNINGTATNDNAAAGNVGEFVSSIIASGSAVTMSNNTAANITSISLTAGDWDVWGNLFLATAGGLQTGFAGWISSTSATSPNGSLTSGFSNTASTLNAGTGFVVPMQRFSLAGTTTIYLSSQTSQSGSGSPAVGGAIYARRAR